MERLWKSFVERIYGPAFDDTRQLRPREERMGLGIPADWPPSPARPKFCHEAPRTPMVV